MRLFHLSLAATVLLLTACQTARAPQQPRPYPEPPVVTPGGGSQPAPEPGPTSVTPVLPELIPPPVEVVPPMRPIPNYPRRAEEVSSPPVSALVRQARQQRAAGKPEQAVALLERALRIESRNAFVLAALGQAYLAQKNYRQAENMAQKSNVVARGNVWVELDNWRTIAAARRGRGEYASAEVAQAQADALDLWLNPPSTPQP